MNLIIIPRKILFLFIAIILITTIGLFSFTNTTCIAVELSRNSLMSNELKNKISNITKNKEKVAYLTFDDGPDPKITPKILNILKDENIKATFFVVGKNVDTYPEIVKRAFEDGHFIANHGYSHNNKNLYKNATTFKNEIKKTDEAIGNAIGVKDYCSHIFRFPNGFMSPANKYHKKKALELLNDMNYTYVDWNCLNNDSLRKYSQKQLLNNLIKSSKNKDSLIILMHDTDYVSNSSTVLKESINYLKSNGYIFKNFYDILE